MALYEYIRIALRVIRAHKFRSFLTLLSITIGAFSIVLMSSLAESGLATLARGVEEVGGAQLMSVWSKPPERSEKKQSSYTRGLTRADREVLRASLPHLEAITSMRSYWRRAVISDTGERTRTDAVAADAGLFRMFRMTPVKGRLFLDEEERAHAKVCVVGHKLAEKLYQGEAVGHSIIVQGIRCKIVGQLENNTHFDIHFGFDWVDLVIVPLGTMSDMDSTLDQNAEVMMRTDGAASNDIVKRIINALLVERHRGVDDFEIFDFSGIVKKFKQTFDVMEAIVGFIAGIALLVGGIGVMNMMLVSVSERVREIGIRKAIGASPRDIQMQFLFEAITLAGLGGVIGVTLGVACAVASGPIIAHFTPRWVSLVASGAVVTALSVSFGIGVVFGFFPARRAARLDAITAMRR